VQRLAPSPFPVSTFSLPPSLAGARSGSSIPSTSANGLCYKYKHGRFPQVRGLPVVSERLQNAPNVVTE